MTNSEIIQKVRKQLVSSDNNLLTDKRIISRVKHAKDLIHKNSGLLFCNIPKQEFTIYVDDLGNIDKVYIAKSNIIK